MSNIAASNVGFLNSWKKVRPHHGRKVMLSSKQRREDLMSIVTNEAPSFRWFEMDNQEVGLARHCR